MTAPDPTSALNPLVQRYTGGEFQTFREILTAAKQNSGQSGTKPRHGHSVTLTDAFPRECIIDDVTPGLLDAFLTTSIPYSPCDEEFHDLIPAIQNTYKFSARSLINTITAFRTGRNPLLVGPTGTGKTTHFLQIAARLRSPASVIPIDGEQTRRHILGSIIQHATPTGPTMTWHDGTLLRSYKAPFIIVLDEIDRAQPDLIYTLHTALDRKPFTVAEYPGYTVPHHPNCYIGATSNTRGRGDDTGYYTAEHMLSDASRDRIHCWIDHDYPTPEETAAIIRLIYPDVPESTASALAAFANSIQTHYKSGEISITCSIRQLETILYFIKDEKSYNKQFAWTHSPKNTLEQTILSSAIDKTDRELIKSQIEKAFS